MGIRVSYVNRRVCESEGAKERSYQIQLWANLDSVVIFGPRHGQGLSFLDGPGELDLLRDILVGAG